jgi:hypothetical protein
MTVNRYKFRLEMLPTGDEIAVEERGLRIQVLVVPKQRQDTEALFSGALCVDIIR